MLSSLFDKTKIRRQKEYGKYNTEVTVKNVCLSFCGVSHLTRCDYSYGPQKKDAEKRNMWNCVDSKLVCWS